MARSFDDDIIKEIKKEIIEEKARLAPTLKLHTNSKYARRVSRRSEDKIKLYDSGPTTSSSFSH